MDTRKSRYPVDLSAGYFCRLDHLVPIKEMTNLLALKTLVAIENNNVDEAINSIVTIVKLAQTLSREPVLVSYLLKLGVIEIPVRNIQQ